MRTDADAGAAPVVAATRTCLSFVLGDELFAIDIGVVREIIQYAPIAPVPLMPGFVRGVVNLRGAVLPVIDLQARLGRAPARVGRKSCFVIFDAVHEGDRVELALLVDAVSAVVSLDAADVEVPPDFGSSVRRDFIAGIGRLGARFVLILDTDRTCDIDEMTRLCAAAEPALAP